MTRYFVVAQDGSSWIGPAPAALVCDLVAEGRIAADRTVIEDAPGATPMRAGQIARPIPAAVKVLGGLIGLAALYVGYRWLTRDPERAAIEDSARRHEGEGAVVCADIPGWCRPSARYGHIPDVEAVYDTVTVIEEYENARSVLRTHARRQDSAFTRWEGRAPHRRAYFQVVV